MTHYAVISNASASPKSKKGIGAYLILPLEIVQTPGLEIYDSAFSNEMKYVKLENTSSTEAEIKTAIKAVKSISGDKKAGEISITLYTDSQNIVKLPRRRKRLEKSDYISKRSGKELKNANLYKEFYRLHDDFITEIVKVEGHKPAGQRDQTEEIFSYVDRKVREKFRSLK